MSKPRRWHAQPPRDDFVVHEGLGVATVRTDHADCTQVLQVLVCVPELAGLHLTTDLTVTAAGGVFTTNAGPGSYRDLTGALAAVIHHLPGAVTATAA